MSIEDISRLLIILAAASWVITAVMYRYERQLNEAALTERTAVSIIASIGLTGFAVIGGSVLGLLAIPRGASVTILTLIAVLVFATQVIWIVGLLAGRFK